MKTLKDIEYNDIQRQTYLKDEFQKAAREWLEEFERLDEIAVEKVGGAVHTTARIFILHFFNLGDE